MEIVFARHGNTFGPGDKVVWVGRETDIPLVEKGREQAKAVGLGLTGAGLPPSVIYAASLKRTREFAGIVAAIASIAEVVIDERLDEIDYGPLGGLTTEEIAATNPRAKAMLDAWGETDTWPTGIGWKSSEADIVSATASFAAERLTGATGRPLVVSSNGVLRFLARALLPASERPGAGGFKLRTGGLGIIERTGEKATLRCWNIAPDALIPLSSDAIPRKGGD